MLSLFSLAAVSALALPASAATIRVDVGNGGLRFSPNSITAARGDVLEFHYFPANHSVVSGRFDRACVPSASGGFFSGFVPTAAGSGENSRIFSVTVNDTNPIVFYCSQNNNAHCRSGMWAVVNPSGQRTAETYRELASNVTTAASPVGGPFGGVFGIGLGTGTAPTANPSTTPAPTDDNNPTTTGGNPPQSTSSRPGAGTNVQPPVGGVLGVMFAAALMV